MSKTLLIIALLFSGNAFAQVDINAHVTNYVVELDGDINILKKWASVLDKQPIKTNQVLQSLSDVFEYVEGEYISDQFNYGNFWKPEEGFFDYWATPKEFIKNGGGDCEDFAIAWYYAARLLGFPASKLNIWIGYLPEEKNLEHAVLAIEFEEKEYIMDNRSSEILEANDYMQKKFKLMYRFNEKGWSSK